MSGDFFPALPESAAFPGALPLRAGEKIVGAPANLSGSVEVFVLSSTGRKVVVVVVEVVVVVSGSHAIRNTPG